MPTVYDQQKQTYSDTATQVRIISDVIRMIDPVDTPLIAALGGLDAARSKFQVRQNGKMIELMEDEYAATAGAFNNGGEVATDTLSVTVADGSILQPGHVIFFGTEYAWVSAVSGNDVTIVRTVGGVNDTATLTEAFSIVGMTRLEGDDADYVGLNAISTTYNYTGIVQKALNVSGTDEAIDYYGMGSPFAYQAAKAVPELLRNIELQLFHGYRAAGNKSGPIARSWGGLDVFMGSNTTGSVGGITKADIDFVMEACYGDGGQPNLLVCNQAVAQDLKDIIDSSDFVRVDQSETRLGLGPLQTVSGQFGSLQVVMDRWCPVSKVYLLDPRKIGLFTLRPFGWKPLAVTGDSKKGEVLGEFSLLVAHNEAHGTLTGVTS